MSYDVPKLLKMSSQDLDALFAASPPGPIPEGEGDGTAIISPGTTFSPEIAAFIKYFAWQGKVFDPATSTLKNRIGPFGLNAILAQVYSGPSWFDHKPCTVLDYSKTSLVAHWIRDELRQIDPPGLYLGKVYWDKSQLIHFALQF
jgi:hypothetical protein